jgi:ABC-type multidrug transport system permease subunit
VTPVTAQPVISEPGYCAFFYPNANCQNKGPGNAYTDPNFYRNQGVLGWVERRNLRHGTEADARLPSRFFCGAHAVT